MENLLEIVNKLSVSLTMPLTFVLVIIFVLRKLGKGKSKEHFINVFNRKLRKVHKPMGITLAVVSIAHGIASQTPVLWGIVCCITIILLGFNYMFRKKFTKPNWMKVHRILSVIMLVTLFLHLYEVENNEGERHENHYNRESISEEEDADLDD